MDGHYGNIAIHDGLKFFEYDGSLCLLGRKNYMKRIYADHYTVDIFFVAEEKLENEIHEDEFKQKEILLRKEREERGKSIQNKESLNTSPWWQNLYISIRKHL